MMLARRWGLHFLFPIPARHRHHYGTSRKSCWTMWASNCQVTVWKVGPSKAFSSEHCSYSIGGGQILTLDMDGKLSRPTPSNILSNATQVLWLWYYGANRLKSTNLCLRTAWRQLSFSNPRIQVRCPHIVVFSARSRSRKSMPFGGE